MSCPAGISSRGERAHVPDGGLIHNAVGARNDEARRRVGARYDFNLALPIAGETPLYLAYRGTFRDNCGRVQRTGLDHDDHVFMIGTSYSFSGDMLTLDRQGATLDTPNFNHGCIGATSP